LNFVQRNNAVPYSCCIAVVRCIRPRLVEYNKGYSELHGPEIQGIDPINKSIQAFYMIECVLRSYKGMIEASIVLVDPPLMCFGFIAKLSTRFAQSQASLSFSSFLTAVYSI
jgi:hypothetical protein